MITLPNYIDVLEEKYPNLSVTITGDPTIYGNLVLVDPTQTLPDQQTLDADLHSLLQTRVWEAIKELRDYKTQNGGSHVGNYWYHSDQASRTQQIALVILGANIPSGLMWKTMSGQFVNMTPTLASQVFAGAVTLDQTAFGVAEQHRQAMLASADPANYDFTTGWPQTYDEAKAAGQTL